MMRSFVNVAGIMLIIFGIAVLGYKSFTYTENQKIAEIGSLKITADTQKTVYFSSLTGGWGGIGAYCKN